MFNSATSTKQNAMRNQKILITSTLAILFIVILYSCQKFDKIEETNTEKELTLKDVEFNPQFDWENTRKITINISSINSQIINITSTDRTIRYYKGKFPINSNTYSITISVPSDIENLNVNDQEITLSSNNISINLQ